MTKRRWLFWITLVLALVLLGTGFWLKSFYDEQPQEHSDPGIPDVPDLPDPGELEE